jgi:hypothetical protein
MGKGRRRKAVDCRMLFEMALFGWKDSFLMSDRWKTARKKVPRSRKTWGEPVE